MLFSNESDFPFTGIHKMSNNRGGTCQGDKAKTNQSLHS